MLEPNIKEGKGGLRDLHTLFWIAASSTASTIRPSWSTRVLLARESLVRFHARTTLPVDGALPPALPRPAAPRSG